MNSPNQNPPDKNPPDEYSRQGLLVVAGFALLIACAALGAFAYFFVAADGLSANDRRLFAAIEQGDHKAAQAALTAGADPNAKAAVRTPLFQATADGRLDIVQLLLQQPAIEVNKSAYGGFTAMDAALQIVVKSKEGVRAVQIAQPAIAKLLRSHGARTFAEIKHDAPSERWINRWPETTLTGTVVARHDDHIEVQDEDAVRRPVMGKTVQQIKVDDQVIVRGHSYPFAPIEKEDTIWAESIEKAE